MNGQTDFHSLQKLSDSLDAKVKASQKITDVENAELMLADIKQCLCDYSQKSLEYIHFHKHKNTEQSSIDIEMFERKFNLHSEIAKEAIIALNHVIESASLKSEDSSTSSSLSSKRAQSEAARVRLEYARKEIEIKKKKALLIETAKIQEARIQRQQSEYDADLELLQYEKEAAAIVAEVLYLEQVETDFVNSPPALSEAPNIHSLSQEKVEPKRSVNINDRFCERSASLKFHTQDFEKAHLKENVLSDLKSHEYKTQEPHLDETHSLPPTKYNLYQSDSSRRKTQNPSCHTESSSLSALFLRKDLITSRLYAFDENPSNFEAWKRGFRNAMHEINASPEEELDILVKHLGKESSQYAISIRNANAASPLRGLRLLWERLEDRFGSETLIENAIRKKLDSFPDLTAKSDPKKLYELSDLLDELASLKENPKYSTSLSFYDSPYGINLIAKKLPESVREQWTINASLQEDKNSGSFPTFSFFSDFVRKTSRQKNNPNYAFIYEKTEEYEEIIANKTEFQPTQPTECPIHHTNHPLSTCRAFKSKTWYQRLNFLKKNHLCFNCLTSSTHSFKTCPQLIVCDICTKNHNTAMHRHDLSHIHERNEIKSK